VSGEHPALHEEVPNLTVTTTALPSVVPLTEIGKAIRKLIQRHAISQIEPKRAIVEHSGYAALSRTEFAALGHGALN
jgi:hypothetical protein